MHSRDPRSGGAPSEQASISDSSRRERGATVVLVLYTRPGCHLCEQALAELVELHREGYEFELHEVDIESDDGLLRAMLERIPVLELNGEKISELTLDQTSVRARLDTVGADDRSGGGGALGARQPDRGR